jgi:hypothetical protein
MLSMPMFTLAIGVLFLCTRTPATLRATLAPIPMITLAVDFASWWLARGSDAFVYVISAAGAVYALAFAIQTLCVLVDLCRPPARSSTGSAAGS